jgi:hypothetical protein
MKNKLSDLNDHLFAQLERLGDEDLSTDDLSKEIGRANAISKVATSVISNAQLVLDAEVKISNLPMNSERPKMLS